MMRFALLCLSLVLATAATAGTLTKRKPVFPPSGEASGELTVNQQTTQLKHSYLMPAPGLSCGEKSQPVYQAYIANQPINDFTLLSPVRLEQQRALGLSYVLIRVCQSGEVMAVDAYHQKLGAAGYVSLQPPFAFKVTLGKDGSYAGSGEMATPKLFLNNEYQFKASFKAKRLQIEPL
jgi:hypothetical protein